MYDPRLARFFAIDPLTSSYPFYTPYQFAANTPIQAIDLEGLQGYKVVDHKYKTTNIVITLVHYKGTKANRFSGMSTKEVVVYQMCWWPILISIFH